MGKFISLVLRHKPEIIGIKLDEHGWANVAELINGMNKVGKSIDLNTLKIIVAENDKQRYSFNENKTKIRANQGHSIDVDIELKLCEPPEYLYHGTASRFLDNIIKQGIKKQSRQYVHLSRDIQTVAKVGARHGLPIVLRVYSKNMFNNGYKFYISQNEVYLTDNVPSKYIDF